VLVVDDEDDLRFLICDLLAQAGYDVDGAPDGQSCIEKIETNAPDVVVLDLMMPRVSGWGVLQYLQRVESAPPVIVLSGMGDSETLARSRDEGARFAFAKPFTYAELLSACDRLAVDGTSEAAKPADRVDVPTAR
jgi:two-component system, OmpR family, response regulator RpaB